jgi:hypothetical protein
MDRFTRTQRRDESLGKTQKEIVAERAAALGRIGRRLEGCISHLHRVRAEIEQLDGEMRSRKLRTYAAARRKAELYFWYLLIQREVNGLTDHSDLERIYSIPGPIRVRQSGASHRIPLR